MQRERSSRLPNPTTERRAMSVLHAYRENAHRAPRATTSTARPDERAAPVQPHNPHRFRRTGARSSPRATSEPPSNGARRAVDHSAHEAGTRPRQRRGRRRRSRGGTRSSAPGAPNSTRRPWPIATGGTVVWCSSTSVAVVDAQARVGAHRPASRRTSRRRRRGRGAMRAAGGGRTPAAARRRARARPVSPGPRRSRRRSRRGRRGTPRTPPPAAAPRGRPTRSTGSPGHSHGTSPAARTS